MTNSEQSTLKRVAKQIEGHVEVKPWDFFLWPQCCNNCTWILSQFPTL
jgi:hypothetical protein